MADKMIVALVKLYESNPSEIEGPGLGFGIDIWDLAARASILSKKEAEESWNSFQSGNPDYLRSVHILMGKRGWLIDHSDRELGYGDLTLHPSVAGIDYAHEKMRAWPIKVWKAVSKPTISIVITIISLVAVAIITYFLTKYVLK